MGNASWNLRMVLCDLLLHHSLRKLKERMIMENSLKENEFKRDNWTNDEVIEFMKGQRLTGKDLSRGGFVEFAKDFNMGIDICIEIFGSFKCPVNQSGAMTYNKQDKTIHHVGETLPR